ncbi:Petal death protein [Bienertia sinuspersici]
MHSKTVVPAEEHAVKIAVARATIGDSDFFLVARTDARAPHGIQEAIRRANLYREVIFGKKPNLPIEKIYN